MDMFDRQADEIFTQAKCDKNKSREATQLWEQCRNELNSKMAALSATEGLSWYRQEVYSKQKETFVEDLIRLKSEHPGLL